MGGRVRIIVCLAAGLLALLAPGAALAQGGTTTSAGDQQYVDPLTSTTSTSPAPPTSAPPSAPPSTSSSTAPSTATATATSTAPATSAAPTSPTGAVGASSGRTLPFTGYNLLLPIGIGLGLLGAGILLRRLTRHA